MPATQASEIAIMRSTSSFAGSWLRLAASRAAVYSARVKRSATWLKVQPQYWVHCASAKLWLVQLATQTR